MHSLNSFFKLEFSYCPLVWMCHNGANNKINKLHECRLRIIYSDKQVSFETLYEKDGSISAHNRNIQILSTEMYKIKNGLSPLIVTELFEQRNEQHYNPRNNSQFTILSIRTMFQKWFGKYLTPRA